MKSKREKTIFVRILAAFILLAILPLAFASVMLIAVYRDTIALWAPEESFQALQRNVYFLITLVVIMIALITTIAAIWASRTFTNPLSRLIDATQRVSKGDLDFTLTIERKDEIGELAAFFNAMVGKIREFREREQVISAMKSEFISIAAHQLRTPLSAVKWTIQLILEGDVGLITEDQRAILQKGYEANERMIRLVGDLLNVARIEEGRFGYRFVAYDAVKLIEDVIATFALKAKERDIKISFEKPEHRSLHLKLDPSRVELALTNLLDNAIKYSLPKGRVVVGLEEKGDFIEISVADFGVGVPQEALHRLFTKFFRAGNVVRLQTEGSGLGLFIVKNIVECHGGKIWATSEENKGTTFYFTLPMREALIPEKERAAAVVEHEGL